VDEKKNIVSLLYRNTLEMFGIAVIAVSIAGWAGGGDVATGAGLLLLGGEGLAFQTLAQLFVWSLTLSILVTLLTSDILLGKVMLLWRLIVLLLLAIAASGTIAFIFRWFALDDLAAWAGFLIFFGVAFGGGLFAMVAKVKLEDKRYSKLLSEYKSKEKQEG